MVSTNEIYTKICNAIDTTARPVFCTQFYHDIGKSLPCMYFRESHYNLDNATTLAHTDEQINRTIEIEIFVNKNARELMSEVETQMKSMSFIEKECSPIDDADPTIERMYARFSRVFGDGDEL